MGQMKLRPEQAERAARLFGLDDDEQRLLQEIPYRGSLQHERQPDSKGDRVKVTMSGKFLQYKEY